MGDEAGGDAGGGAALRRPELPALRGGEEAERPADAGRGGGAGGGGRAGVTEAAALAFLDSGEGEAEIAAAQRVLQDLGIHSIPTTLVDGQFSIGGALPADEVEQLFRKLEAEEEEDGEPVGDAAFAKRFVFAEALGIPPGRLLEELDVLGEDPPPGGAPTAA